MLEQILSNKIKEHDLKHMFTDFQDHERNQKGINSWK